MSKDYFDNTLCLFLVNKLNSGHNTQVYTAIKQQYNNIVYIGNKLK